MGAVPYEMQFVVPIKFTVVLKDHSVIAKLGDAAV